MWGLQNDKCTWFNVLLLLLLLLLKQTNKQAKTKKQHSYRLCVYQKVCRIPLQNIFLILVCVELNYSEAVPHESLLHCSGCNPNVRREQWQYKLSLWKFGKFSLAQVILDRSTPLWLSIFLSYPKNKCWDLKESACNCSRVSCEFTHCNVKVRTRTNDNHSLKLPGMKQDMQQYWEN